MNNEYLETQGLGAGSYPEEPEPKEKCYQFEFNARISGYGIVYAEDELSASLKAKQGDYDEIMDTWDMEIEEITSVTED